MARPSARAKANRRDYRLVPPSLFYSYTLALLRPTRRDPPSRISGIIRVRQRYCTHSAGYLTDFIHAKKSPQPRSTKWWPIGYQATIDRRTGPKGDASIIKPMCAKLRFYRFDKSTLMTRFCSILFCSMILSTPALPADVVDFSLPDTAGVQRKLSDYRGKWLVINFWATWCAPCLKEIPELIQFHNRHKDNDAIVIGIDFEEIDLASLRAFMNEQKMNYPVLRAGSNPLMPFEPLLGLPSTFLVSPQGMYVDKHVGPITLAQLEEFVAKNKDAASHPTPTFSRREIYWGIATFAVLLLITGAYAYRRMTAKHRQNISLYK